MVGGRCCVLSASGHFATQVEVVSTQDRHGGARMIWSRDEKLVAESVTEYY